jgi:hypothetical protein
MKPKPPGAASVFYIRQYHVSKVGKIMSMYETQEVQEAIPDSVRPILWFMLQELDEPKPNHHFELSAIEVEGESKQHIIHTQRSTSYRRDFSFKYPKPITMSVYIVGFEADDWLMLLKP